MIVQSMIALGSGIKKQCEVPSDYYKFQAECNYNRVSSFLGM